MASGITVEKLKELLELHEKWLNAEEGGKRLDLSRQDLRDSAIVDLLRNANLENANLENANLYNANLENANLYNANLYNANLKYANLENANLENANLKYANLENANLYNANLENANLYNANLYNANLDEAEQHRKGVILKEAITGYKKCMDDVIVELEIPKGAIVFAINGKKHRTNKAKVISISNDETIAYSKHDSDFTYELGMEYEIEDFNLMYNVECASGIHFFRTREEAEDY